MSLPLSPSGLARRAREIPPGLWAAAVVAVALAASYAPSVWWMVTTWESDPAYSHGFLVAPIAILILWQRRDGLARIKEFRPSPLGWLGLLGLLGARYWLYERNEVWAEGATVPIAAACLVLALGGRKLLLWAAPGLLFLLFLLPLPPRINIVMAAPLQRLATMASSALLVLTGLPVLPEGNVIWVGTQPLEVARACNGLSMLLSFVTLITAVTILARSFPLWQRVVLMLSTVPIALTANVLRIVATAWAYHLFGQKFGDKIAHDTAGWLMMPLALVLVWIELKILDWLVVPEVVPDKPIVFLPPQAPPRPVKKKGIGPAAE